MVVTHFSLKPERKERNLMKTLTKVPALLSTDDQERLAARTYTSLYTNIPQRALPTEIQEATAELFNALTGETLSENDSTWTVYAKDGNTMSGVFGPAVGLLDGELTLRWNFQEIPIRFNDEGSLVFPNTPKAQIKLAEISVGKFKNLALTVKHGNVIMPFTLRVKDLQNKPDVDVLEALIEGGEVDSFLSYIGGIASSSTASGPNLEGPIVKVGRIPTGTYTITNVRPLDSEYTPYLVQTKALETFHALISTKSETGEWEEFEVTVEEGEAFIIKPDARLNDVIRSSMDGANATLTEPFDYTVDESMREVVLSGPVIKMDGMVLGEYEITGYKTISSKYTPFLAQTRAIAEFSAQTSHKVNGEWVTDTVTLVEGDPFIIKPNSKLTRALKASPIVTQEKPGFVEITGYGEYKGYPTAECEVYFDRYSSNEKEIKLNF